MTWISGATSEARLTYTTQILPLGAVKVLILWVVSKAVSAALYLDVRGQFVAAIALSALWNVLIPTQSKSKQPTVKGLLDSVIKGVEVCEQARVGRNGFNSIPVSVV